ncbi:MAG: sigma-54-dependent Fis family transcriptional regulator [Spirochaetes bacterium]|nr:sigma-54-dependent Fis family transcriptional regulator [Spirochaetota bacterium]
MDKSKKSEKILVVDDSADTLEIIQRNLKTKNYQVYTAKGVEEALNLLSKISIDLVITDIKMPKISGFDLIKHVRDNFNDIEIIVITGYPSINDAIKAVKDGAEEYLPKPFTDQELLTIVEKTLEKMHMRKLMKNELHKINEAPFGIVGNSHLMQQIFKAIEKSASTNATILIQGESGTGKELVARAIHYSSLRASAPFIPVNCGSIPENLLERELFGHVKGAFTGAIESRAGFFQTADGGTIFLDEISETSTSMQVKLLRVLQDKEICMIGSGKPQKVDVRILIATNKDLYKLVNTGLFREDLYYRINIINIHIPPLRDRENDILLLIRYFCSKFAKELKKKELKFSDNALQVLKNYSWPGNVRELENIIYSLMVMNENEIIDISNLPSLMKFSAVKGAKLNRTLCEVEEEHIRNILENVHNNKTKAATILGIDRKTLREKLKNYRSDSNN